MEIMQDKTNFEKAGLILPDGTVKKALALKFDNGEIMVYTFLNKDHTYSVKIDGPVVSYGIVDGDNKEEEYLRTSSLPFIPGFNLEKARSQLIKDDNTLFKKIQNQVLKEKDSVEVARDYAWGRINELRSGNAEERKTFVDFYSFLVSNGYLEVKNFRNEHLNEYGITDRELEIVLTQDSGREGDSDSILSDLNELVPGISEKPIEVIRPFLACLYGTEQYDHLQELVAVVKDAQTETIDGRAAKSKQLAEKVRSLIGLARKRSKRALVNKS